ncbi:MAG: CHAD domain-containing protein [Nitrospirales bacterium]
MQMEFRLAQSEPFMEGMTRLVHEQIDRALKELSVRPIDPVSGPHQVRKRCKKIRALIRLAKTGMKNRRTYQQENRRLRDAARMLSDIRDAQVMIETYDHLMAVLPHGLDRRAFGPIRRQLSQQFQRRLHTTPTLDIVFREIQAGLEKGRQRISDDMLDGCQETALYTGLKTTYAKASHCMSAAFTRPTDNGFHEWRKHVKYHWYHCRLLRDAWNPVLSKRCDELHDLEEYLGEDHDLGVFEKLLVEPHGERHSSASPFNPLLVTIRKRKHILRRAVRQSGCRLFVESPNAFSKRMCSYWKIWIQESPRARETREQSEHAPGL